MTECIRPQSSRLTGHYTPPNAGMQPQLQQCSRHKQVLNLSKRLLWSGAYFTAPPGLGIFKRTVVVFPMAGCESYCTIPAVVNSSKSLVAFIPAWHKASHSGWLNVTCFMPLPFIFGGDFVKDFGLKTMNQQKIVLTAACLWLHTLKHHFNSAFELGWRSEMKRASFWCERRSRHCWNVRTLLPTV